MLTLVSVGLAAVASSDVLHRLLLRVLTGGEPIVAAYPTWGIALFVLFSALSAMLAFFSTAVIVPLAVRVWGGPLSMLLLWTGWLLGGICAYAAGRFLGRPVIRSFTSGTALARFEHRISSHAPFSLVLLFQLALPSELPGYLLGLVRYRFVKYLLAVGLGELPYAIGTVYLGASFVERRTFAMLALGVAGALFIAWAVYTLQKRLSA